MALRTRLTELLGIEHPIIQGGMAWTATAELAGAVSNAGGLGIIGAGHMPTELLREQIRHAKALTDRPFGVNLMLLTPHIDELVQLVLDEGVPAVTTGAGNPGKYMAALKARGIKVLTVVPSVALAKRMESIGADAVIGEGMEAGGHIGELTTMVLTPQLVDAVEVPVVAAGGIADGRGMAAAFALGAEGVQVGTRFMCAEECTIHPSIKAQVVKAKDRDTVVTGRSTGHPVRVIKNKLARQIMELDKQNRVEEIEALGQRQARARDARGRHRDGLADGRPGRGARLRHPARSRDRRRDARRGRGRHGQAGRVCRRSVSMAQAVAFTFPGQGSQRIGMLESVPPVAGFDRLLDAAEALSGLDLRSIAAEGPEIELADTRVAQPLLYLADWAWGSALLDAGVRPVSGRRSLARRAGGARDRRGLLGRGRTRARRRAQQAHGAGRTRPPGHHGGRARARCRSRELVAVDAIEDVWVANDNAAGQVVISGRARRGRAAHPSALLEAGARKVVPLKVAGAFHSPFMEPACAAFADILGGAEFADARVPVYQNTAARAGHRCRRSSAADSPRRSHTPSAGPRRSPRCSATASRCSSRRAPARS